MERILDLEPERPRLENALKMRIIMPIKWTCWEGGVWIYVKCLASVGHM